MDLRCVSRRCSARLLTSSDGPDLISALPDDMLLLILTRLHCIVAAARTMVLSSRWRRLWTCLSHIFLSNIRFRSIETVLDRLADPRARPADSYSPLSPPAVSLIDIRILSPWLELSGRELSGRLRWEDTASTTSLLGAAARLEPEEFVFELHHKYIRPSLVVELPCFQRATSIVLALNCVIVPRFPADHEFTALETLSLSRCKVDIKSLLSCCPRLRTLRLVYIDFKAKIECKADSPCQPMDWKSPLEEVEIDDCYGDKLDFLKCAPMLKKLTVNGQVMKQQWMHKHIQLQGLTRG